MTAALFVLCALRAYQIEAWTPGPVAFAFAAAFSALLVAASAIDFQFKILPDRLTLRAGPVICLLAALIVPGFHGTEVFGYDLSEIMKPNLASLFVGVCGAAVGGAAGWLVGQNEWLRRLGIVLAIAWIAALATLSWQRAWYFESSLALFEDAVAHNPDSFFTRYSYGSALQQRARREEAMAQYRVALEIDPGGVPAWVEIGLLHSQRGERALAIEAWQRAVARDPLRSRAHWKLGLAWLEEGETERGLGHLERSVEIVTPAPSEWERRRSGYAQLGQILLDRGLHARATTNFERSLELDPGHHAARLGLARSLVAAGRRRAAPAQIDIVLSARSNHVQARRLRARLASP